MDRSVYNDSYGIGTFTESSVKTPGFHELVRLGKRLPNNSYLFRRLDAKDPVSPLPWGYSTLRASRTPYYAKDCWSTGIVAIYGGVNKSIGGQASFSAASGILSNRILDKIRDQDIDLGVSLGEYKETSRFVAQTMVKTARSYRMFRKGDVSGALRVLTGRRNADWRDIPGVASNVWLAYTYGLRPLINDVYGALKALEKRKQDFSEVKRVRTSYTQEASPAINGVSGAVSHFANYHYSIRSRAEVRFYVTNPLLRVMDQVGLINPLNVAWELMPYSFVVDWFLPVGKTLQGIVPPQGVSFFDGWISHYARGSALQSLTSGGFSASSSSREFEKQRSKLTALPRYNVIVPDLSLSKSQIASGLALLFQASAWGKEKQRVRPEPPPSRKDERNWRAQWPPDPWWSR